TPGRRIAAPGRHPEDRPAPRSTFESEWRPGVGLDELAGQRVAHPPRERRPSASGRDHVVRIDVLQELCGLCDVILAGDSVVNACPAMTAAWSAITRRTCAPSRALRLTTPALFRSPFGRSNQR